MAIRKIIEIDEERCDGCGECIISCAEGALEIVDGKAKLVKDIYCDGLGACIGECPQGALTILEREAVEFDEEAVEEHLTRQQAQEHDHHEHAHAQEQETLACGCPGSSVRELPTVGQAAEASQGGEAPASALQNWPLQLHLVPVNAPYFEGANLLIAADCTGFALTDFHRTYLPNKTLIIACPKLDDAGYYVEKLTEIFKSNNLEDITVLYMTVPCCSGLVQIVRQALANSGKDIPLDLIKLDFNGDATGEERAAAAL